MTQRAIYQRGNTTAQTFTYLDPLGVERASCTFEMQNGEAVSDNKTAADYLIELNNRREPDSPEFEILPMEEALALIEQAQLDAYETNWQPVSEDYWNDHLDILPPEKWETVRGVEIFRMCEYLAGNITEHLARIGNQCFSRNCSTRIPYETLAKEINP